MPAAEIEIINKLGLHARASAKLSQLAAEFPCEIFLSRNGRQIKHYGCHDARRGDWKYGHSRNCWGKRR